jgi:hypothetical protein
MSPYSRFNVFSVTFGVAYMAMFFLNEFVQFSLFGYYPVLHEFSRSRLPLQTSGPAIFWYGWLAGALAIGLVAALLTPRRWAEAMGRSAVWTVPAALLILILVYERRWFY